MSPEEVRQVGAEVDAYFRETQEQVADGLPADSEEGCRGFGKLPRQVHRLDRDGGVRVWHGRTS